MPQGQPDIKAIVDDYARLLDLPLVPPEVKVRPLSTTLPVRDASKPCALLLTPHPDDECLTGGLALRLLNEKNWQIVTIAITLGSHPARRTERKAELAKACAVLGFDCALGAEEGFSDIDPDSRISDADAWQKKTEYLAGLIGQIQPQALFIPHDQDWHKTHIGAHLLAWDALARLPQSFSAFIVQTEYWQPMADPNLMIGLSKKEVATLMAALSCHSGEVSRNPYDRRFPSYLIANAGRGGERLQGKGAAPSAIPFAMLYKQGLWHQGKYAPSALCRCIAADEPMDDLLA